MLEDRSQSQKTVLQDSTYIKCLEQENLQKQKIDQYVLREHGGGNENEGTQWQQLKNRILQKAIKCFIIDDDNSKTFYTLKCLKGALYVGEVHSV